MQVKQRALFGLKVTLGLYVDHWRGPHPHSSLDRVTVGRTAFLALLETWLGLSAPQIGTAERTAAYLLALRRVDSPDRFFHSSLNTDEVGTAAKLLQWRDEWILGGWSGAAAPSWNARLADMADTEVAAVGVLPPGEGDRIAAVLCRLNERSTPISEIELLEERELFPALWRRLIDRFPGGQCISQFQHGADHTQLGRLQRAVLEATSAEGKITPLPDVDGSDGSLIVVRPYTAETAEHWLAQHSLTDRGQKLLVSEVHGPSVDDTLRVNGIPACGFDEPSPLRPSLQALPLVIELFWDPVDPARVLEFLTHPLGPFSASARRKLGAAFAERPGIGGPAWNEVKTNILEGLAPDQRAALEQKIGLWLESPRYQRSYGASIEYAIDRISLLLQAVRGRLQHVTPPDTLATDLGAAIGQCSAMLSALKSLQLDGITHVRPRLLEQLCSQATTDCGNSLAVAEATCMLSATASEACALGAVEEVVWWMPSSPRLPQPHPWSRAEIEMLTAGGVELLDTAHVLDRQAVLWMRPLFTASNRLIVVLPPEPAEHHPAWQLISLLAPALSPFRLEEHSLMQDAVRPVTTLPLQRAEGAWTLDINAPWRAKYLTPTRRTLQSYTSLDLHFNNPAIAVLKYAADLRANGALSLAKGTRLFGNLAHRLVEQFFSERDALRWSWNQLIRWFEPAVNALLVKEGMPLLAPGNGALLRHFTETARHGLGVLLEHMTYAKVDRVQAERSLTGSLSELQLTGSTDLLLHLADGSTAALDLKWSNAKRYRDVLANGEYLQLALYADMIRQELGKMPIAVGYFTFCDAMLLTQAPDVFGPQARVISAKNEANVPVLVEQAKATWAWRVRQWQHGLVEVIGDGLDPQPGPPPDGCLPLARTAPWNGEYTALFGNRE